MNFIKKAVIKSIVNYKLTLGLFLCAVVVLFGVVGPAFYDIEKQEVGAGMPMLEPSSEYPLGTDAQGRDVLAWVIAGTPATLRIGLLAGILGVVIGAVVAFVAGFYGGWVDTILRILTDVLITVPGILILVIAASMLEVVTIELMAIIIASLAWMGPARVIRSQVLVLREKLFVDVSRLSGEPDWKIVFLEVAPNLMPFLLASFVSAVAGALLASIGLEVLGLGPAHLATLGQIIFWVDFYNALLRGAWWWWGPPILVVIILFVGLFLASVALDEIANPRLKTRV
ncbi:MAG: maltose ABC transporter permease [Chloroflexi bacterium]|nr:maltose ABC transporter permease [Chloroflexota bacterium]|tara:strand:- start:7927 stop:8781 length:855 start_codon:yes stop_codon:yes gene_type:complete